MTESTYLPDYEKTETKQSLITLSNEQQAIHDKILNWYNNGLRLDKSGNKRQYITMGGLAGTGKTTLISFLSRTIKQKNDCSIAYVAYTGKASSVLRKKLKNVMGYDDYCGTIHSLIYKPLFGKNGKLLGFGLKDIEEIRDYFKLIILDEASMVGKEIFEHLKSFDVPILCVGDYGQIPPVSNDSFSLMEKPDLLLKEIHRQALDNPIIGLSMKARESGEIPAKIYGRKVAKFYGWDDHAINIMGNIKNNPELQVLCGMNRTRVKLNHMIREQNGFKGELPQVGEKLICLKNMKDIGIMNGMTCTLLKVEEVKKSNEEMIWSEDDSKYVLSKEYFESELLLIDIQADGFDEPFKNIFVHKDGFGKTSHSKLMAETYDKSKLFMNVDAKYMEYIDGGTNIGLFDWGYSISVHKSQGSEWEKIVLVEEYNNYQTEDDRRRWLYTGITRASFGIVIIEHWS